MFEPPSIYDEEEPFQEVSFSHISGILICYCAIGLGCIIFLMIEFLYYHITNIEIELKHSTIY